MTSLYSVQVVSSNSDFYYRQLFPTSNLQLYDITYRSDQSWPVAIGFEAVDILHIDTSAEEFKVQLTVYKYWYEKKYQDNEITHFLPLDDIPRPQTQFVGAVEQALISETVTVLGKRQGLIRENQTWSVTFREQYEMHNFPFDTQPIHIVLRAQKPQLKQHFMYHSNSMDETHPGAEIFQPSIAGFLFQKQNSYEYVVNQINELPLKILQITFKRSRMFYIFHLYFPLLILQLITFTLGSLDPGSNFNDILNVVLIQLLAVVAFRYSLSNVLPTVAYLTLADLYFIGTFALTLTITSFDFMFCNQLIDISKRRYVYYTVFALWGLLHIIYFVYCFTRCLCIRRCQEQAQGVIRRYQRQKSGKIYLDRAQFMLGKEKIE